MDRTSAVQSWKEAKEEIAEPMASTSSSLIDQTEFTNEYQERLAIVDWENGNTAVRVSKLKCVEVENELKLTGRECNSIISFQNSLACIGGWTGSDISSRVDLVDPRTGHVLPLPEMSYARLEPACAANDRHIFVFGDWHLDFPGTFTSEFYEKESNSWLPLPSMFVERCQCAAVYIPDTGVLVLGGEGRSNHNEKELKDERHSTIVLNDTELLTCDSNGGKKTWTWRLTVPMLTGRSWPRAIYFQQRVYVIELRCDVGNMEMLNLSEGFDGCQWTSLTSFGTLRRHFKVSSMAKVDGKLFIRDWISGDIYTVELDTEPEVQHDNLKPMKRTLFLQIEGNLEVKAVAFQSP